jgi:hypothetical protein
MLDLSRNEIGDEGAKQLGAALQKNEVNYILYSSISLPSVFFYTETGKTAPLQESNSRQGGTRFGRGFKRQKNGRIHSLLIVLIHICTSLYRSSRNSILVGT